MARSLALKRIVSSATRSIVATPIRTSAVATSTNQRGYATSFMSGIIGEEGQSLSEKLVMSILKDVPHTFCRTTRLTRKGEVGIMLGAYREEDAYMLPEINKGLKFSLIVPGVEKIMDTPQGLSVFLDMGLNKDVDFDDQHVEAILNKDLNALFIKCCLQEKDVRNYCYSRVDLSPQQMENNTVSTEQPIKTEIKDGGLMVTIPKAVNKD